MKTYALYGLILGIASILMTLVAYFAGAQTENIGLANYFYGIGTIINFAIIYLGLNDLDQAFAFFRAAADEHFASLASIFVDPLFDGIRSDPRFVALSRDLKLPLNPSS